MKANKERDSRKIAQLNTKGWRAMTVWQCSLFDQDKAVQDIEEFLNGVAVQAETAA